MLILLLAMGAFSQSKKDLETQKNKRKKDIEYTNKLLREVNSSSKNSYNTLLLLNKKIKLRQELINSMISEIKMIEQKISENQSIIESLQKDLEKLKSEYAAFIYYAYKNRSNYDRMMFIFSSEDFNTAYKRLKYLQYYTSFRKKQKEIIIQTQNVLIRKNEELEKVKAEKKVLIDAQQEESVVLSLEKTEQTNLLSNLKQKEAELKKQLTAYKRAAAELEKAIQKIIEEEAKKATKNGDYTLTPEQKLVSDNFGANKGRLPWPTIRGEITSTFGEHDHPVLPGIKVRNNGIDISTSKGSNARAIFEGEVRQVLEIPGANKAVIIRHGAYLSVYQNMTEVFVQKGDKVTAKEDIGRVATKAGDNTTTLHLEIWKENAKLDPASWIAPK